MRALHQNLLMPKVRKPFEHIKTAMASSAVATAKANKLMTVHR